MNNTREKFFERFTFISDMPDNIRDDIWSFIEQIEKEAEKRGYDKGYSDALIPPEYL